jgi:hypothetical protein
VGDEQAARPGHRGEHRVEVEGRHRAQVDHLDRDAVLRGQRLGGGEGLVHHARHRHHGDVGALPDHLGHPDGHEVVGRRLRALHPVEQPVLDEHHRVRVLDGRPQQPVGVGRRRGHHHGEPGDVGEQGLEALRVLAAGRAAGAELGAHGDAHPGGPAGHEGHLRRLVQQLVEAHPEEVEVHDLDHRAHAGHGRAHAEADHGGLGDGRVPHPVAEAVVQAAHEPEHVAPGADVDAGDEDPLVGLELRLQRAADGVHGAEHGGVVRHRRRLGSLGAGPQHEVEQRATGGSSSSRRASSTAASSSAAISAASPSSSRRRRPPPGGAARG